MSFHKTDLESGPERPCLKSSASTRLGREHVWIKDLRNQTLCLATGFIWALHSTYAIGEEASSVSQQFNLALKEFDLWNQLAMKGHNPIWFV